MPPQMNTDKKNTWITGFVLSVFIGVPLRPLIL